MDLRKIILIIITWYCLLPAYAQDVNRQSRLLLMEANELYRNGDYVKAIEKYNEAQSINPSNEKAAYNVGNSQYRLNNYKDAAAQYEQYANQIKNPTQKAKALHNLGNSYLMNNEFEKAITAYKQSLKLNPSDEDTRYNLIYAMKKLQQQQQQQQDKDNKNQDKQQEKDQQEKDKNQKDQQEKDQQEKDQQEKDKQQKDKEGNQHNGDQQKKIDKEQAKKLLDALNNQEKQLQQKINKEKEGVAYGGSKDW